MNTKRLTLIVTVAAATALSNLSLNAAEAGCCGMAKPCHTPAVAAAPAAPSLAAPSSAVAASPKVFANFPYLAGEHTAQPAKPMAAHACCVP